MNKKLKYFILFISIIFFFAVIGIIVYFLYKNGILTNSKASKVIPPVPPTPPKPPIPPPTPPPNSGNCDFLNDQTLINFSRSPPLAPNPQTLRKSNGKPMRAYKLSLYHGGFLFNDSNTSLELQTQLFIQYLKKMASYVAYANYDIVYLETVAYTTTKYPYLDPEIIYENLIKNLPPYTAIGILGYIDPKDSDYALVYQNTKYNINVDYRNIVGGFGSTKVQNPNYGKCNMTATCSDDFNSLPCTLSNYKEVCPLKTPNACYKNSCISYANGCPSDIEQFLAYINIINYIVAVNNSKGSNYQMVTRIIFDGESLSNYGNDYGAICQLVQAAKLFPYLSDLINPAPENQYNTNCKNDLDNGYCAFILNGKAICPNIGVISHIDNSVDYNSSFEYSELYWIGELNNCACKQSCKFTDSCTDLATAVANGCCDPSDSLKDCKAKCNSCYNNCRTGTVYQQFLNNPTGLLNYFKSTNMYNKAYSNFQFPGSIPAFSIENIGGAKMTDQNICIQKLFGRVPSTLMNDNTIGNPTACGTFNGFGSWSWDAFEQYMDLFYSDYLQTTGNKILEINVYEYQFIPILWLSPADQADLRKNCIENTCYGMPPA